MSDPEARLAAALLAALKDTGYLLTHEYADSGVIDVGDAMVRADPTLAADLALAEKVRRVFWVDGPTGLYWQAARGGYEVSDTADAAKWCGHCQLFTQRGHGHDHANQTPEARLAAALDATDLYFHGRGGTLTLKQSVDAILAAYPTLAADLALAAAVREWEAQLRHVLDDEYHRGEAMKAAAFRRDQTDMWLAELLTAADAIIKAAKEAERE